MKSIPVFVFIILCTISCSTLKEDNDLRKKIKEQTGATNVRISSAVKVTTEEGKKSFKNIVIGLKGINSYSSDPDILSKTYPIAKLVYHEILNNKWSMPDIISIKMLLSAGDSREFKYKTDYLKENQKLESKLKEFHQMVMKKDYGNLHTLVDPETDLTQIIEAFKKIDGLFGGIKGYELIGMKDVLRENKRTGGEILCVDAWTCLHTSNDQKLYMLFVFNPEDSFQLTSLYINPK